jgi:hypothetical protein
LLGDDNHSVIVANNDVTRVHHHSRYTNLASCT